MRKITQRGSCVLAFLLAGALIGVSCGGSDEAEDAPCDGALKGKCGKACENDTDCEAGTYCGANGKCTADCAKNSDCGNGKVCSPVGRCVPGINLDSGGNDGTSGEGCINVDVTFEKQIPTVVLLIDQSGSMAENFGGAGTRWNVVKNALMDPTTGIVKVLENDVRFGLALYTSHDGNNGGTCPILTDVMPPTLGNYDAINAVYGPANEDGETPTGESIDAIAAQLAPFSEPGPKAIVLATDGEPDTCAEPNPQNGQDESIAAAQAAYQNDISTYIISVGADVSLGHLQDMANAGIGLPVGGSQNAPFYQALDQAALVKAFNDIIYGVRPCTFQLNGKVEPGKESQGSVNLDSQPLGYNDPDGWKLNGDDEVELVGAACSAIKSGDHDLKINFPCGSFVVPPTK